MRYKPVHAWFSVSQKTHAVAFFFSLVFAAFCGQILQKWLKGLIGTCLLGTRWYNF